MPEIDSAHKCASQSSSALAGIQEASIEDTARNRVLLIGLSAMYVYGLVNGLFFEGLSKSTILGFWVQDFVHFVAAPGLLLIYVFKRFDFKPSDYGLIKGSPAYPTLELVGASVFTAVVFGLIVIPIDFFSYYYFLNLGFERSEFSYKDVVPQGAMKIPVVFYMAITAGLMEEVIFRGIPHKLIFENQELRYKKLLFILGTSIAFSTVHWTNGVHFLVPTFIFGLFAAWLYIQLKNLWPLVGGHFLYDFYVFW